MGGIWWCHNKKLCVALLWRKKQITYSQPALYDCSMPLTDDLPAGGVQQAGSRSATLSLCSRGQRQGREDECRGPVSLCSQGLSVVWLHFLTDVLLSESRTDGKTRRWSIVEKERDWLYSPNLGVYIIETQHLYVTVCWNVENLASGMVCYRAKWSFIFQHIRR